MDFPTNLESISMTYVQMMEPRALRIEARKGIWITKEFEKQIENSDASLE